MTNQSMSRITLVVSYLISKQVLNILEEMAIPLVFWQYARRDLLNFNSVFAKIFGKPKSENERMEQFIIYVPTNLEHAFYQKIIRDLDLSTPGRGSLYSQNVHTYTQEELNFETDKFEQSENSEKIISTKTHGITLIIGRGQADHIAYQAMEKGYAPPTIIFGEGMGSRDKLGLVRITIPPEKEIMNLTTYYQDLPMLLALLRQQAHLDLPGKGLLYHYPLTFARMDTKTQASLAFNMASTDQIISAIDTLMNNTDWRRKNHAHLLSNPLHHTSKDTQGICLNVFVPYGIQDNAIDVAFNLGVRGATKSYYRSLRYKDGQLQSNKDYNVYTMVMSENLLKPVITHLQKQESLQSAWLDSYHISVT